MKPCIFCQIARGQLPAEVVYENRDIIAFLDHRPLFPGHVLVVPRAHRVTLVDLLPQELAPLMEVVRLFSGALPRALGCQGSFVANNNIVSQSVPHLHFHVVPRTKGDGLKGFFWPRLPYTSDEHRREVGQILRRVARQEEILDFWFGPLEGLASEPARPPVGGTSLNFYHRRWFNGGADFDREIGERFGEAVEQALRGELDDWVRDGPRGRLALLILLDQFTRNLFRHTARAFAGDERAQGICLEGLEARDDARLNLDERVFFYLPLEHGESRPFQELSLARYTALLSDAPEALKPRYQGFLDYAQRHADIIFRFDRYPHRNQALGRASTPQEAEFLSQPGSSFW